MGRMLTAADRLPEVGDVVKVEGMESGFSVVRVEPEIPRFWVKGIDDIRTDRQSFGVVFYVSRADGQPVTIGEP